MHEVLGFSVISVTFLCVCVSHFWFRWPCLWHSCVSLSRPDRSTLQPQCWSFWSLYFCSCCTCSNSTRDSLSSFGLLLWVEIYTFTFTISYKLHRPCVEEHSLLYMSFFCFALQDVFNSVFAAVFFIVLSLMALATYTVTGMLVGGVRNIPCPIIAILVSPYKYPNNVFICARAVAQQHEVLCCMFISLQVVGLISAVLLSVDCFMLFKNITFNKPRSETTNQGNEWISKSITVCQVKKFKSMSSE